MCLLIKHILLHIHILININGLFHRDLNKETVNSLLEVKYSALKHPYVMLRLR